MHRCPPPRPSILEQIEGARAYILREQMTTEPLRQVDNRLARQLGVTLDELKELVSSGEIPAAQRGNRGGLYVTTSAVDRWHAKSKGLLLPCDSYCVKPFSIFISRISCDNSNGKPNNEPLSD